MKNDNGKVYFVLFDDGTWGGGFTKRKSAEAMKKKNGGQIVVGKWFKVGENK